MNILENASLLTFNTFGFDVKADFLIKVASKSDTIAAIDFAHEKKLPIFILGQGSNVVLTHDIKAVVIHPTFTGLSLVKQDNDFYYVKIAAGMQWHDIVLQTLALHYYGLENLSLIPGLVGAAPIQNIGAYGVELCEVFDSLEAIDLASGQERIFNKDDCQFAYRDSVFKNQLKDKYFITSVTLKLFKKPAVILHYAGIEQELAAMNVNDISPIAVSEAVCRLRQRKLPDPKQIGNAGSFFKNPVISFAHYQQLKEIYPDIVVYDAGEMKKVAAGWLLEKAGWKGTAMGNVAVHDKQALVLINANGKACGSQLMVLARDIIHHINKQFGIELEIEPRVFNPNKCFFTFYGVIYRR
jgi:UDP-N-acetylmuramate dehydrogenase